MTSHQIRAARGVTSDDGHTYTRQQKWLHWISATVILWATITGFLVTGFPHRSPWRQFIDDFNPQITTLLMPIFAWRIYVAVREMRRRPAVASNLGNRLAQYAHVSLYAVVTAVLISGALMMQHDMNLLGVLLLPQLITSQSLLSQIFDFHRVACIALAALIALHVAAVVKHSLAGAPVLPRMM